MHNYKSLVAGLDLCADCGKPDGEGNHTKLGVVGKIKFSDLIPDSETWKNYKHDEAYRKFLANDPVKNRIIAARAERKRRDSLMVGKRSY